MICVTLRSAHNFPVWNLISFPPLCTIRVDCLPWLIFFYFLLWFVIYEQSSLFFHIHIDTQTVGWQMLTHICQASENQFSQVSLIIWLSFHLEHSLNGVEKDRGRWSKGNRAQKSSPGAEVCVLIQSMYSCTRRDDPFFLYHFYSCVPCSFSPFNHYVACVIFKDTM